MIRRTDDLRAGTRQAYDAIIDVRSPSEFAEDHLPGAMNLPVLDDAQRAEVGTLFVQRSKFLARRLGASYVARNIADHLDGPLADRGGGFQPLVYCWRGGQRSTAVATVMDQVGWPVTQLDGGYQTWRRRVVSALYGGGDDAGISLMPVLLDGFTGSGKTDVLGRLATLGVQTLDLEGLADHRGSLFGATPRPQPSQKAFETRLYAAIETLDLSRPVVVEAESSRVGQITLPPVLWAAMRTAPRVQLTAPLAARVAYVVDQYGTIGSDAEALEAALRRLPRHHSRTLIETWRNLARGGRLAVLVEGLMTEHYDPAYRRSRGDAGQCLGEVEMTGVTSADLNAAAQLIATLVVGHQQTDLA
ncbi:tRNA 2-selenouridine(34) synthase MnmH [soil metagenome]